MACSDPFMDALVILAGAVFMIFVLAGGIYYSSSSGSSRKVFHNRRSHRPEISRSSLQNKREGSTSSSKF